MRRSLVLISAAVLSIAAFSAPAQTARPDFNRAQVYDVQHYTIRTSFDRTTRKVFGDTTVTLRPIKADLKAIDLDAEGLAFESVKLEPSGTALQHKAAGGKVTVWLDRAYGPGDTVSVRFKYTASPKKGVYFVEADNESGGINHSEQIWTQGEPDEARHWFPSFDFPSDKATTEQYVTVEKGNTVIANGQLVDKIENANGTETWHYNMPVAHSTYLVSFVIGKYVKVEDKYKDIPLGFYVYPGKERTAVNAFGTTKDMIRVFEDLTGVDFPYNKYDQTIVSSFQFGGMENITATTMADTEILLADFEVFRGVVIDLVSHELAHSWFGDLVTCRNWAELWLNEGFATFMEAAYREKANGREDYLRKIRADSAEFMIDDSINKKRHGLYNLRAGNVGSLFDNASVTYHKGGVVVHMLREQVGTEAFWKGINIYLNRHRVANVESTDLQKAMEEASGQNLGWFFDQWVYGIGAPKLDIRQTYVPRTKTLKLTVTQTQRPEANVPAAFRLPLDVEITTPRGSTAKTIDITKRIQTFTFRTDAKPTTVTLDRLEKIPLKTVKQGAILLGR
jgi:aminopeptidase N